MGLILGFHGALTSGFKIPPTPRHFPTKEDLGHVLGDKYDLTMSMFNKHAKHMALSLHLKAANIDLRVTLKLGLGMQLQVNF